MNRMILFTSLLSIGCAHTGPEEMTVDEHRAEAHRHEAKAQQEEAQYQPGQEVRVPGRTPFTEAGGGFVPTTRPSITSMRPTARCGPQ